MAKDTSHYISFITDELKKGNVERASVLAKCGAKWQMASRTFDRLWAKAQEAYKKEREEIEKQKADEYRRSELNRNRELILSREKALEMQTNVLKLIYNKMAKSKEPSSSDTLAFNATMDRLAKLEGWDAAKKTENTHKILGDQLEEEFID